MNVVEIAMTFRLSFEVRDLTIAQSRSVSDHLQPGRRAYRFGNIAQT